MYILITDIFPLNFKMSKEVTWFEEKKMSAHIWQYGKLHDGTTQWVNSLWLSDAPLYGDIDLGQHWFR